MSYTDIHLNENGEEIEYRPAYYTIPDLAKEFKVKDSKIRFWYEKFAGFFDADVSARVKKFNDGDVEIFRTIYRMREQDDEGMDKIRIYLSENIDKIKNPSLIVDESKENKLLINTLVKHAIEENLNIIKNSIVKEVAATLKETIEENNINYIEANKKIYSEVEDKMNSLELKLDESNSKREQRDIEMVALLKENLEFKKKLEEEKNKGFWSKLLKR